MNQIKSTQENSQTLLDQCNLTMLDAIGENDAARFHLLSGGGRTRAKLCISCCTQLGILDEDAVRVAACIELLHNASLVHDDLQDNDTHRRDTEATWLKFGKGAAICAGDLMVSEAYKQLSYINQVPLIPELLRLATDAVAETISGQTKDIASNNDITADSYEDIAAGKSAPLFQLSILMPLVLAGLQEYSPSASMGLKRFAVAYQIIDDLGDWESDAHKQQLNIVNLHASKMDRADAIFSATTRAEYLLNKCIVELKSSPNNCALAHYDAACALLTVLKRMKNE